MSQLDVAMKDFAKKYGDNYIEVGVEKNDYDRIPFSSPRLNYMTFGGLPLGHIIEFSGPDGSGKTSTVFDIIKNAQQKFKQEAEETHQPERIVVFIDVEGTYNYPWARKFGVDTKKVIRLKLSGWAASTVLNEALKFLQLTEVGLLIIDSLAAMPPDQLVDKSVGDKIYGGIAQSVQNFTNVAKKYISQNNSMLICINQVRDNLGSMFGGTITPGGRGFKHACSVRLEFRKGRFIDSNNKELANNAENPAGNIINVVVIKSKVFPSTRRVGYYTIKYLTGPDTLSDYIELGIQVGVINQKGAYYDVIDPQAGEILNDTKIQGKNALRDLLNIHKDWLDLIDSIIHQKDIEELVDTQTLAEAGKMISENKDD